MGIVMKGNILRTLTLLVLLSILSACGTTSKLRNAQGIDHSCDFSNYNTVVVNDFKDGVTVSGDDPNIVSEGKRFADIIASNIRSKNAFTKVVRNQSSTEHALLIDGEITQYDEGNTVARMLVGFGAGSSHFDAKVYAKDNSTKKTLADIKVDHHSWALGGAIAGAQDVKSHMNTASVKIASEVAKAKQGN